MLLPQTAPLECLTMEPRWRTHQVNVDGDALALLDREWLLTNGTGAFAMGSLPGVNTRRYHGLLVAATRPPVGRVVALNQVLESLDLSWPDGRHSLELASCLFRDEDGDELTVPGGYRHLRRFEKGASVAWTYAWRTIEFRRQLILHWKAQAVTLVYHVRFKADGAGLPRSAKLRLSPMLTLRDFHSLLHGNAADPIDVNVDGDTIVARRHDLALTLRCPDARFVTASQWWYGLHYPIETRRGQDDVEDVYVPGAFQIELDPSQDAQIVLTAALGEAPAEPCLTAQARQDHLAPIVKHLGSGGHGAGSGAGGQTAGGMDDKTARLFAIATDDFVVDRSIHGQKLSTIVAGYPWFADWGRDTFIALPGLLLETGRFDEARATLRAFAEAIRNGLVPNRFDDYDDSAAHYNTVDASLWFVQAAMRYVSSTGDRDAWRDWLGAAAMSVLDAYIAGTDFDIKMTGDCLISAGSASTQLTWMDAARDGVVFTPRHGKAVEINALWYASLVAMAELIADEHPAAAAHYNKLAGRANRSFIKVFWNQKVNGLVDHVWTDDGGEDHIDASIRPNQIFVASLPHSPLPRTRQRQIVKLVRQKLLTPVGLRTLPKDDPHYHGRYDGDMFHRDEAYHQGTVWGWLIGPYAEAVLRVGQFSAAARKEARQAIAPLLERMAGAGLGQLHEIFAADEPHDPVGCIAQAWTVAEVLRVRRLIDGKSTLG